MKISRPTTVPRAHRKLPAFFVRRAQCFALPLGVWALVTLVTGSATDARAEWTGAAGNGIYNDSTNWAGGTINGSFTTVAPPTNLLFDADITTNISFQIDTIAGGTTLSGSGGTRTIKLNGDLKASGGTVDTTITIANSLIIDLNGASRAMGNTGLTGTWNIAAKITGTGGLTLGGGTGSVNLTNDANDFTGNVAFNRRGGSFSSIADSGVASAIGAGSAISASDATSNGGLTYTGGTASSNRTWNWSLTSSAFAFNHNGSGTLTLEGNWNDNHSNAVNTTINANTGNLVFNGVLNGNNNLVVGGVQTKTFNGLNTFTGTVSLNAGVLEFNTLADSGTASALGKGTTIKLGSGSTAATLRYTGTAASGHSTNRTLDLSGTAGSAVTVEANGAGALKFTSALTASGTGAKTLALGGTSDAAMLNEIGGAIIDGSGTTSVTKSGANTWVLSGGNSYTGNTTVSGGILLVSGSLSGSAVAVNGGTFGGAGSVTTNNKAFTLASGAKLDPGTNGTIGLSIDAGSSSLDIRAGVGAGNTGALLFNLGAEDSSDRITLTLGTLQIGDGELDFADFDFTASTGFGRGTYTLFDTTALNGSLAGSGLRGTIDGFEATLELAGTDVVLTVVPEPNAMTTLLGGLGLLLGWRRVRRIRPR